MCESCSPPPTTQKIPYLPKGRTLQYVLETNPFMQQAKEVALTYSLDPAHPTGVVIVRDEVIIGQGANGSTFHKKWVCIRKKLGAKTGTYYWLCPGCQPWNHAEQKAIRDARMKGHEIQGADIYLWGHWWCCKGCWSEMIDAKIRNVYLCE